MKRLDLSRFMRLDAAAIEALKLLPSKRDGNFSFVFCKDCYIDELTIL